MLLQTFLKLAGISIAQQDIPAEFYQRDIFFQ